MLLHTTWYKPTETLLCFISFLCAKVNKCIWEHSLSVAVSVCSMGREQVVIIEMIGLLFSPNGWKTSLKSVCAHTVVLLLGCSKVHLPDAFAVSPFESVIVVDFKKWIITKQPCCSLLQDRNCILSSCCINVNWIYLFNPYWVSFPFSQSLTHTARLKHNHVSHNYVSGDLPLTMTQFLPLTLKEQSSIS